MTSRRSNTVAAELPPKLIRWQRTIDGALARLLRPFNGSPTLLHEAMGYCVASGGKRFRPLLCLAACEAVGGKPSGALSAACAIELIHSYSLVHDDLPAMDDANERRGKPSCHRQFGEAAAILVGDALLTRAFEVLASDTMRNAQAIQRELGRASGTWGLIGGQLLDLATLGDGAKPSAAELRTIASKKTAALITASVVIGGLAGNASTNELRRLRRYGERLGLAFQLVDDVQDGDGLVAALGAPAVRREAIQLLVQVAHEASSFGRRGHALLAMADWLASTLPDDAHQQPESAAPHEAHCECDHAAA